jgi:uncharacterized protein (DUF934 family)
VAHSGDGLVLGMEVADDSYSSASSMWIPSHLSTVTLMTSVQQPLHFLARRNNKTQHIFVKFPAYTDHRFFSQAALHNYTKNGGR